MSEVVEVVVDEGSMPIDEKVYMLACSGIRKKFFLTPTEYEDISGLALGIYLGYPLCCIENFHDRVQAFRERRFEDIPQEQKLDGTGFIPCPKCQATKSEDTLREEIEFARMCPTPFPDFEVQ